MIPPARPANRNSSRWASSVATRPRSTANDLPGIQPGTRSALEKHPQSFTSSLLSQHPVPGANENSDRLFCLDHPEIRGVSKPASIDPRQDSTANRQRDNFSGLGLSSPAPQQPLTKPFSGSPSRHYMTDPLREAREAGRQRPGIIYPLPRAARPDTRLDIDAALLEAAALDRRERPPTVVDIAEPGQTEGNRPPGPSQQGRSRSPRRHSRKRPRIALLECIGPRSAHHTVVTVVSRLRTGINSNNCYKQEDEMMKTPARRRECRCPLPISKRSQ